MAAPTMQFYLGPMSLNVIQAALAFHKAHTHLPTLTFIPSRRQVDYRGGYVGNRLTMEDLRALVGPDVIIERDHGGPNQGTEPDNGWESLANDAEVADILHLDPWKERPDYEGALTWTQVAIEAALEWNPRLRFEVGTEEAIRPIQTEELRQFLTDLQARLTPTQFAAIQFVVVQCGTALKEGHNTGAFDEARLKDMLDTVHSFGKTAKEHNGDWISAETVAAKAALGLRHINIAPELGAIESVALHNLMSPEDKEAFWELCWKSRKWEKWVTADFDPAANKPQLVEICGHYVFSDPAFAALKARYPAADQVAQEAIQARLNELYSIKI